MNIALLQAWRAWDIIYYYSSRLQYVDKQANLFRVVLLPYWGQNIETNNGAFITKGDLIVKIHIHNYRLAEIIHKKKDVRALGILLLREIRGSLPGLAHFVANHPEVDQIKGLVGTTFLHRGAEGLGFTTSNPKMTKIYQIKAMYLRWMLRIMHPEGKKRLNQQESKLTIKRVFMSKEELLQLYLK